MAYSRNQTAGALRYLRPPRRCVVPARRERREGSVSLGCGPRCFCSWSASVINLKPTGPRTRPRFRAAQGWPDRGVRGRIPPTLIFPALQRATARLECRHVWSGLDANAGGGSPPRLILSQQQATARPECRHVWSEPDANEADVTTELTWVRISPPGILPLVLPCCC